VPDAAGEAGDIQWNFEKFLVGPGRGGHRPVPPLDRAGGPGDRLRDRGQPPPLTAAAPPPGRRRPPGTAQTVYLPGCRPRRSRCGTGGTAPACSEQFVPGGLQGALRG
jgi:hypothetical protein